jgi:hypothetical protein
MANGNFLNHMASLIGQTVTIFTTSGGESGRGFTGVLAMVNPSFVRLITQIGPAPGCALGNCCEKPWRGNVGGVQDDICADYDDVQGANYDQRNNVGGRGYDGRDGRDDLGGQGRASCRVDNLGSIVDIPVDKIASFVHNAVGGSW